MELKEITRPLYPDEISLLEKIRQRITASFAPKFRLHHYLIAVVLGAALTYVAVISGDGYLRLVSGTLAVIAFCFLVFGPSEAYKKRKRLKNELVGIEGFLQRNAVATIPINALKLAIAEEYDDEGDLVIVEYAPGNILYMWDHAYSLGRQFPCLQFEIYEKSFFELSGMQVYSKTEIFIPVKLDKKAKWSYIEKYGTPTDMHTEKAGFNEVIDRFLRAAEEQTLNLL